MPSFALARTAPLASRPMISSICRCASSGCAPGQVDLVDDRDDLEVVLDRQIGVRQRLRLDALRRVHEQQRAFAGGERARHLVRKIDVPGRVDEVQHVLLRRRRPCSSAGPACALIVIPRSRSRSIASSTCASISRAWSAPVSLEEAVGERRLAVVDVGDDREITDEARIHLSGGLITSWCVPGSGRTRYVHVPGLGTRRESRPNVRQLRRPAPSALSSGS